MYSSEKKKKAFDLTEGKVECSCAMAFFAAILAIFNCQVQAGTVNLEGLAIQVYIQELFP